MRIIKGLHYSLFCLLLSFSLSVVTSSCGYHFGDGESIVSHYSTISVPYVVGDEDGSLTAAVIKELVASGAFEYQFVGGALILNIAIVDEREDHIGFRYDRKRSGKLTKDTIPTETRITETVEVYVTEAASCKTILGPVRLRGWVDFDHDFYSSRNGINIFSLGQLTDIDAAYDAVQTPLNHVLARKIVDYVRQSW